MTESVNLEKQFTGLLLGTAVGDALGLPSEGLPPSRIQKRWKGDWQMRLVFGRGMVSDDTEHSFLVAQSLLTAPGDAAAFRCGLAARLRWWFLALPAGVGWATARACLKLWLGFAPERSGVFSAGNGPAMRSAILGAFFADDERRRREFVVASTRLTHTDPKAQTAALAVAEAVAWTVGGRGAVAGFLSKLRTCGATDEWLEICRQLAEALTAEKPAKGFARSLGLGNGVTGYAFHTVPVAIYSWLRHPHDFRNAMSEALDCGGDTDTVGAIAGAIVGCNVGPDGIPAQWLNRVWEWPRTLGKLRILGTRLAQAKAQGQPQPPVHYFWIGVLPRNLLFFFVILGHGLRRLFPPY